MKFTKQAAEVWRQGLATLNELLRSFPQRRIPAELLRQSFKGSKIKVRQKKNRDESQIDILHGNRLALTFPDLRLEPSCELSDDGSWLILKYRFSPPSKIRIAGGVDDLFIFEQMDCLPLPADWFPKPDRTKLSKRLIIVPDECWSNTWNQGLTPSDNYSLVMTESEQNKSIAVMNHESCETTLSWGSLTH